jgi:hypothetical protein
MQPRFEQFIRERQYLHNVTPATIEWYRHSLKWLPTEQPSADELKESVLKMREKGRKATGCNSVIRAINAYLHWSWFIEGLDLWLKESGKMADVSQALDGLQRIATRKNIAIIASVGSPKQKTQDGKDTERYRGRDVIFGSVAWGRKAETIVLISKTDMENDDSTRQYSVLPRNGRSERFWMDFTAGELRLVDKPTDIEKPENTALSRMEVNVLAKYKPGEIVVYTDELGPEATFYRWRKMAAKQGKLTYSGGIFYLPRRVENKPN